MRGEGSRESGEKRVGGMGIWEVGHMREGKIRKMRGKEGRVNKRR